MNPLSPPPLPPPGPSHHHGTWILQQLYIEDHPVPFFKKKKKVFIYSAALALGYSIGSLLLYAGLVALQHVGSYFPEQVSNPVSLHWKVDS